MDETILKQRQAMEEFEKQRFSKETVEEENRQSIFQGSIEINKIPVTFAERRLFDGRAGIWMPEDFEPLPEEAIAAIYLLGNKPELVFANSYLTFSVGFHYTEHEVPNEYMGDFSKITRMILQCAPDSLHKLASHSIYFRYSQFLPRFFSEAREQARPFNMFH